MFPREAYSQTGKEILVEAKRSRERGAGQRAISRPEGGGSLGGGFGAVSEKRGGGSQRPARGSSESVHLYLLKVAQKCDWQWRSSST